MVKVKVALSCLTLCDSVDYAVQGMLQARILEWVVFSFSRGYSQPRDQTQVSRIAGRLFTRWATGECDTGKKFKKKKIYRSIQQDRRPTNKSTFLWSINLLQRRKEYKMQKAAFQQIMLGETVTYKIMKLEYYLTLYSKTNVKRIKDLSVRPVLKNAYRKK